MSDMNNPSDENSGALDDLWADALNEQQATPSKSAADAVFQQRHAAGHRPDYGYPGQADRRTGPYPHDH
ncbi:Flagellar motor switch protein FliN [compost metagenome]